MFQTLKEENKNLGLKIISVKDVQQINGGMSSSLRGNKKFENQNLQKVSEDIINNFLYKNNLQKKIIHHCVKNQPNA